MIRKICLTERHNWIPFILRITIGVVMLPHGLQKMFGWFGGKGFIESMDMLHQHAHIPKFIAFLVIFAESFGALSLILGGLTRFSAFFLGIIMFGAIFTSHLEGGFISLTGYPFHVMYIAICTCLVIKGGGKLSIDAYFYPSFKKGFLNNY